MVRAHAIADTGSWNPAGSPVTVEYLLSVLERIRTEAVVGFCRFPRGGIEIGGILFGTIEGNRVRILESRPVASEYATGPSYVLSEKDQRQFGDTLEAAETDPQLAELTPVGWYHSHTRSEIFLSERDLEIHNRYFPGKEQIALVVRPEPFGPTWAGFFVRESEGSIRAESSYHEFPIAAPGRARAAGKAAPEEPPEELEAPEAQDEEEPVEPVPIPLELEEIPFRKPVVAEAGDLEEFPAARRSQGWLWAGAVVVGALAAFLLVPRLIQNPAPVVDRRPPLALRVSDTAGQLQIKWDQASLRSDPARSLSLEIVDGGEHVIVPLDTAADQEGAFIFPRRSDNVEVHLRVERATGRQEESVRFLGAPVPAVQLSSAPSASAEAVRPAPPPAAAPPEPVQRTTPEVLKPAPKVFDLARLPVARTVQNALLPAPPTVDGPPARAVQVGAPALPSTQIQSAPPPAPAPAPPVAESKPKPVAPVRRSGRILWTGDFRRGVASSFDGHVGAAVGDLPGLPVRMRVYPADLSNRGLTVFVSGGRDQREPPGPQNGWSATSYIVDPRRAGELLILEAPSAQNGWKKLTVRNDTRDLSVILIDWNLVE